MGEQRRWVVSVDEETHRLAEQWQADFSPLVGSNRSSLVRLVFKTLARIGMTAATVTAALEQSQRIKVINSEHSEFPVPQAGQAKPPVRVRRVPSGRGREFGNVSRRSCVGVRWACLPPFSGKVRPFKSNSFRQVA